MNLLSVLLPLANAGTTLVETGGSAVATPDAVGIVASCPSDAELVGGGAGLTTPGMPFHQALAISASGNAMLGRWQRAPGTPTPGASEWAAAAVCTTEASCLDRNSAWGAVNGTDVKSLVTICPAGTYAIGGGFSITGNAANVEVTESGPVGLFVPVGWRTRARELTPAGEWGLYTEVRCVPWSVLGEVTRTPPSFGWSGSWNGPLFGYGWTSAGQSQSFELPDPSAWLLSMGGRVTDQGGLVALGPVYEAPTGAWSVGMTLFGSGGTVDTANDVAFVAEDPEMFGKALDACDPRLELPAPPYFEIGADIWFGVIGGGGGVIFLPGKGPIPVDPEPFKVLADALPAVVAPYADERALQAMLDEVVAGLDAERAPYAILDDVADTATIDFGSETGVVLVTPRDEAAAVEWMSANRDTLARLGHVTVVPLIEGGAGMDALARW